ncbi:diphosphomevalonate decarboxylase [Pendulispora rubella]|uniref:diphosphomevalonate decarboxylase n=1 Tax=Pendulispora rubella TaxID=2741070 RepID=A0ABZ2LEZ2_9BACT
MQALAEARANIALVKYWGKLDAALNLPAVPSLSLTVDALTTRTSVRFDPSRTLDALFIDQKPADPRALGRVSRHLDRVVGSAAANARMFAEVRSTNDFPTAGGLASSASAFAALTLAAVAAAGRESDPTKLSVLARQASGSAARSILGGLVLLGVGTPGQVDSSFATQVASEGEWPDLRLVIGIASEAPKEIASTDGMNQSESSPYYAPWTSSAPADIARAMDAIARRDLPALGAVAERSALRMHACALAADPGVVYLRGPTVEGLHAIRKLRARGVPAWFTCDAGPHPKALTSPEDAAQVARALAEVPGIQRTIIAAPGKGALLLDGQRVSASSFTPETRIA